MLLYYTPGTCALACWIALEWAGADYRVEKVDPHSEAYRKVNPLAQVPAIDIGGPRPVGQAGAILHYIAERYPEKHLGADEGLEAALAFNETMSFLTGDFHPAFWPWFVPQRYTTDTQKEALAQVRAAAEPRVARVLEHLDGLIGDSGHVHAGRRSVADAYAFVMARWSERMKPSWRDFPHLAGFIKRMGEDEAVKSVLERSAR